MGASNAPMTGAITPSAGLKLLVDTNVWLDFFIERSTAHDMARQLIIESQRHDVQLLSTVHSIKDSFFLINAELKRMECAVRGSVSPSSAQSIREIAWSCAKSMRKLSYIVPADDSDAVEAILMRADHPDFEDNLIAAAALRARADYVVTSDAGMLSHQPVPCITPEAALDLVIRKAPYTL